MSGREGARVGGRAETATMGRGKTVNGKGRLGVGCNLLFWWQGRARRGLAAEIETMNVVLDVILELLPRPFY
jgi:hypothetical protein